MKEWFKIGSFLMLLFLLTAEDCSDKTSEITYEKRQAAIFSGIENEFEKERLLPEDLKAFESRSLQMFTDLIDYINIYADSSLSKEFRLQSKQMIKEMFYSDVELNSFFVELDIVENIKKGILLYNGKEQFKLQPVSFSMFESFSHQPDLSYSGSIRFKLSSSEGFIPQERILEIRLQKSPKQFGESSVKVWEVFLGRIK